ncbi:protein vraC [Staphylococcus warneri]|uniref:protein vraC n=1 Tax=Staphylococcus warneri TaxID=1292 RepID=UPI0032606FE7
MQYYSKDGLLTETRNILFNKGSVRQYCEVTGREYDGYVPELYCAVLWNQFDMFKKFTHTNLYLKETQIEKHQNLVTCVSYKAKLRKVSEEKIKKFVKFKFVLEINKDDRKCINIEQTFVKVIE